VTSHRLQERIDKLQAHHAAEWLEILRARRPEDMAAFAAWCRESPVHVREFLEASWVHHELAKLDADQPLDVDSLLREIAPDVRLFPEEKPTSIAAKRERKQSQHAQWPLAAAACGLLIAAGFATFLGVRESKPEYVTQVGEQRTIELADNSVVKLNTDSAIQVNFADDTRQIELRHGEAVFKVTQDRKRPFRVHTRAAVVLAVGTQFNVYDRPEGTDVTVLEGRVRVMPRGGALDASGSAVARELVAGEEARIGLNGSINRVAHPDVERVTAWSKRRLKFERTSLDEMVSEFNRYNRVQLRTEGIAPNSRFYRGIFDADDPNALVDLLQRESDLVVERHDNEIVIRHRD
jgi:transmembrane sensor